MTIIISSRNRKLNNIHNNKKENQKNKINGAAVIFVRDWKASRNRPCTFNMSMDALQKYWRPNNPYSVILAGSYW